MNGKYESIILVVNRAELSRALDLYNKLISIGKKALILTKDNIIVSDKKVSVRSFLSYRDSFKFAYSNLTQEVDDLFSSLAKQEVSKNLSLRELTKYKGVSLWDLSAQDILPELLLILHDLNILEAVLNFERPGEVYVINGVNNLGKVLELICKKRQIPFFIHKAANRRVLNLNKFFCKFIIFAKKIKRLLANLHFLFANLTKSKNLNKEYKVIFFTSLRRYLASILPITFKYNNEERLVINAFPSSSNELKEAKIPYMDFYGYKPYSLFNNRDARNLLRRIRNTINKNSLFCGKLLYKEVAIGTMVRSLFEKLIYEVFPHNMQKVDIARKILLSYRPEVIVAINSSIDIVLTAKTLSVPVVVVQSGHADEFRYLGPITADAVTVNGNYWKDYLLKTQDVDPNRIWVTGPPKFDILLNDRIDTKDSDMELEFDRFKKRVVFAVMHTDLIFGTRDCENKKQIRSVCHALKKIKEAHLIIKLHPYEKDLKVYKEIVQETGLTDYSMVKDAEMLKLLRNCDLLITHISTAGYEAVLLDKNVISLFGSSKFDPEDIWNFKKYGAAIVVDNLGELEKYIRKALFDPETISKLREGRNMYTYEHGCKLDGNASGRIKEVIDRFIRSG